MGAIQLRALVDRVLCVKTGKNGVVSRVSWARWTLWVNWARRMGWMSWRGRRSDPTGHPLELSI